MARRRRMKKQCPKCLKLIMAVKFKEHEEKCDWKVVRRKEQIIRVGPLFKKREKVILVVALLIIATIGVWQIFPEPPKVLRPGDDAPEISWSTGSLNQALGKIVLVNFMDVDCEWCQHETNILVALYDKWVDEANSSVVFLSVNVRFIGDDDDEMDIWNFKADYNARWQFVNDDDSGTAVRAYHVTSVPTSFVLNPDLTVREVFRGAQTYQIYNTLFNLMAVE